MSVNLNDWSCHARHTKETKVQRGMCTFFFIKRMNTEQNHKTNFEASMNSADKQLNIKQDPTNNKREMTT
jgi:hypothetical protein